MNPLTLSIDANDYIHIKNGISYYTKSIYVQEVSQLFLDIVRQNIVIVFIAAPKGEQETLSWCIELIDPEGLEEAYLAFHMNEMKSAKATTNMQQWEDVLRLRFREYTRKLYLSDAEGNPLTLRGIVEDNKVKITGSN